MPMFLLLFYIPGVERCMECGENCWENCVSVGKTVGKTV